MSNSPNLLFVSIAFPPKNDPECLQTAKYFKYLAKQPLGIDVVTSKLPTLFMPEDPQLQVYAQGLRQLIEIPLWENRYTNFLLRKIVPQVQRPDSKFSFFKQWKKVPKRLKEQPEAIYSRAYPLSSAFMAAKLQEHYQVPWILHLSDPWSNSPIHHYSEGEQAFHDKYEQQFFEQASYIGLTSYQTIALYQQKYPEFKEKFLFFPNVFDPEVVAPNPHSCSGKLRFVYTGGLTGARSPEPIFKALQLLEKEIPQLSDKLEFVFAGQFDRQNQALFSRYDLDCVQNLGLLSYPEALELQKTADVLMVIDTPFDNPAQAMFFPSKLLDYITAQRSIWALTNTGSTTYELVEGTYGSCFEHNEVQALAHKMKEALAAFEAEDSSYFYKDKVDQTLAADYNAQRLAAQITSLINH